MWISKKEYKFLKENAEKNIDAECEILRAKEKQDKAIARAAEEYSALLKECDELKLKIIELENKLYVNNEYLQEEYEDFETTYEYIKNNFFNSYSCNTCSSNPKNGGSGICHCTLGTLVTY